MSYLCTKSLHLGGCLIYEIRECYTVGGRLAASVSLDSKGEFEDRMKKDHVIVIKENE